MFWYILGEVAVDEFFYSRFIFKFQSFLDYFQHGSCSLVKGIMALSATLPSAIGLKIFCITVISKVSHTWILSSILKIFAYQTSFWDEILTKAFCQYILNLMSKKKRGSFNYWTLCFIPSYFCHDSNIFWPVSFLKFPWRCWTEFSKSWKYLRKTLRSHEIFRSLINLGGAKVGFVQIQETGCFEFSWYQKSIHQWTKICCFCKFWWTIW